MYYFIKLNQNKIRIHKVMKSIRNNFFSIRVLPVWNSLPSHVVSASSIDVFKSKLRTIDLKNFYFGTLIPDVIVVVFNAWLVVFN